MEFQKIENKNMNSRYFEKSSTLDVVFFISKIYMRFLASKLTLQNIIEIVLTKPFPSKYPIYF